MTSGGTVSAAHAGKAAKIKTRNDRVKHSFMKPPCSTSCLLPSLATHFSALGKPYASTTIFIHFGVFWKVRWSLTDTFLPFVRRATSPSVYTLDLIGS